MIVDSILFYLEYLSSPVHLLMFGPSLDNHYSYHHHYYDLG